MFDYLKYKNQIAKMSIWFYFYSLISLPHTLLVLNPLCLTD